MAWSNPRWAWSDSPSAVEVERLDRNPVALLDDPAWEAHATAGNPNWLLQGSDAEIAQRKQDLINFMLSIDATTEEQGVPAGFDGCP